MLRLLITAWHVVCLLFLEPKGTQVLQTAAIKCSKCSLKFLLMGRSSSNGDSDLLQGAHVAARLGKAGCKDQCVQLIVSLLEQGGGGQDPLRGRGLLVFLSLRRCHMILSMSLGAASHTPQSPLFDPQWKQSVESGRGRGWYFRIFGGHRKDGTGDFYVFQWGELLMGLFWVLSEKRRR